MPKIPAQVFALPEVERRKDKEMKIYRQGDVLFKQVKAIPSSGKLRKNGELVEGETTGHVHRVCPTQLAQAEVMDCGAGLFMRVSDKGVSIVHEEHGPIILPAGNYEVLRQVEYSPAEIRNVAD